MDIKKALTFTAFGFLFTLVNLNLNFGQSIGPINFMPDFVGWALLYLALGKFGRFSEGKDYLRWVAIVMIILSGVLWVMQIMKVEMLSSVLTTVGTIITLVFNFIYFGILEDVAEAYGSSRKDTIHLLKIVNLALYLGFTVMGIIALIKVHTATVAIAAVLGAAALVSAVIGLVVLFGLRKEISARITD